MGPSLTRLTDISAPNFPDSTVLNLLSNSPLKSVNNSWPVSGSAACEKLGLVPFFVKNCYLHKPELLRIKFENVSNEDQANSFLKKDIYKNYKNSDN